MHKLALALGKTVGELLTGQAGPMSGEELADWEAYDLIEPFGEWRADMRAAQTTAAVYGAAGVRTRPAEFLLKPQAPERPRGRPVAGLVRKLRAILGMGR